MHIECPHCGKDIQLIGTVGIKQEFGLGPNAIETRRQDGRFPDPVLDLGNRLLFIRSAVEDAIALEQESKIVELVQGIESSLARLPKEKREKAKQLLAKQLDGGI